MVGLHRDDPEIFHVRLTGEYYLAARQFGLGADDFENIVMNSICGSFLPEEEKAETASNIKKKLDFLREKLLF